MHTVVIRIVVYRRTDAHVRYKAEVDRHVAVGFIGVVLRTALGSFVFRLVAGDQADDRAKRLVTVCGLNTIVNTVNVIVSTAFAAARQTCVIAWRYADNVIARRQHAKEVVSVFIGHRGGNLRRTVSCVQRDQYVSNTRFQRIVGILNAVVVDIVEHRRTKLHHRDETKVNGHVTIVFREAHIDILSIPLFRWIVEGFCTCHQVEHRRRYRAIRYNLRTILQCWIHIRCIHRSRRYTGGSWRIRDDYLVITIRQIAKKVITHCVCHRRSNEGFGTTVAVKVSV